MENQPKDQNKATETKGAKPPKKIKKSTITIIAAIVLVVLALVFIVVFAKNDDKEQFENTAPTKEEVVYGDELLGIDPEVDKQLKDYRNIVLLGIDAESYEKEPGHRSDGIIVLSVNKKTDEVKMFSVYRDTYLKIDDSHGLDKVTHAYAYGGMNESLSALNSNLDLNIREGMAMTWKTVGDLVDDLGGVDVTIEDSEISFMNKGLEGEDQITSSGTQTINGDQAVMYCRIRYDSSDYKRNDRMKIVLAAALNKAKTLETDELIEIMDDTVGEMTTNMSKSDMTEILMELASYDLTEDSVGWPYDTTGWMHDSIFYGVPRTLETNVSELHEEFFGQKDYVPTEFVQSVSDEIESVSGYGAE